MSTHSKKKRAVVRAGGIDLTTQELLDVGAGLKRLLAVKLPIALSLALRERFQVVKFAQVPVSEEDTELTQRYATRDKRGRVVVNAQGGYTLKPATREAYWTKRAELMATKRTIYVKPISQKEIPETVDGKPLLIEGEVFELLSPILVD